MASRLLRVAVLAAALVAADSDPPNPADIATCCNALKIKFGDKVAFDGDPRYPTLDSRYVKNAQGNPTCIFLPSTSDDVAAGLSAILAESKQMDTTCPFAIKSGGVGMAPGANDIAGGITFDLSWINSTSYDEGSNLSRLGAGATWAKVTADLDGTGIAVPVGDPVTGVGGTAVAGGFSWLTPRTGLLSWNIVNIEVVLADGLVHNVNSSCDPDLFMALLGGGNNFGIVTYVDVISYKQGDVWGGIVKYPLDVTGNVLTAFKELVTNSSQDPGSMAFLEFTFVGDGDEGDIMAFMLDTDDDLAEHPALNPLLNVQPHLASQLGQSSLCAVEAKPFAAVNRSLMATVTIKNDATILAFVHDYTNSIIRDVRNNQTRYVISYQPLPTSYNRGENVLGLNYTTEDLIIVNFNPYWDDPTLDYLMYTVAEKWTTSVQQYLSVSDAGVPFEYLGYAAPFQAPFASYGASNLQFLRDVAKKYDPEGVFQTFVPGGAKLG